MANFAAQLASAFVTGFLSDRFGRRPIFFLSLLLQIGSLFGIVFAPNIYVFIAMRMIEGASGLAIYMTSFIIVLELVGPSKRVYAGTIICFFWAFGLFATTAIAYLLRNWQYFVLSMTVPQILLMGVWFILPESPRWLLSRGRTEDVERIVRKMASVNGVVVAPDVYQNISKDDDEPSAKITEMFTSKQLFMRSLIIFFNWLVISFMYHGLTLNVQNLVGDIYVNSAISAVVETIAYVFCIALLDRLGRKALHCGCMVIGGLACVTTLFPVLYADESLLWITNALSMIGRMGISGAFAIIYLYSAELFPTIVRNSGMGCSSTFARIGGMVAPYISDLGLLVGGDLKVALPQIVFGAFAVAAGLLSLFLPETLNRKLPETVNDAKLLGQPYKGHIVKGKDNFTDIIKGDVSLHSFKKIPDNEQ